MGDELEVTWRSFLLRPAPSNPGRTLEDFKRYTRSWRNPQAEEPRAGFREWASDEGPPSHSVPPHRVAKAAERIDADAFEKVHDGLLDAYFRDSRDITSDPVLEDIWLRAALDPERFAERNDPTIAEAIQTEFQEALSNGAAGAPAVRMEGAYGVLMGAQPTDVYRTWLGRATSG